MFFKVRNGLPGSIASDLISLISLSVCVCVCEFSQHFFTFFLRTLFNEDFYLLLLPPQLVNAVNAILRSLASKGTRHALACELGK